MTRRCATGRSPKSGSRASSKKDAATADRWQQVAQIYLAAVERDPAGRGAFLHEACAGDEGLRREVESLLGYEGGAEALLERPAAAVAAPMLNHSASSAVLTGRQIGPYQIGALLGAGGLGEVYRARDTKLNREVALKVLTAKWITSVLSLIRLGGTMIPRLARITMILASALLALAVLAIAQPKDTFVGTWRLNVAKSKYSPGPPAKSSTVTYEAAGAGYKVSVRTEPASGAVQEWSYTTNLDGRDSAVTGTNPNADSIAAKRIDANTIENVSKMGGKVTITSRIVVSADGKTRTNTQTGMDAKGQKVSNVLVFERQ